MTPTETAAILRQFNEWRRGDEDIPQPHPREIGEAIDAAIEMIESAEEERALCDKLAGILARTANVLKGEPKPLHRHSWHDLPEVAQRLVAAPSAQPAPSVPEKIKRVESGFKGMFLREAQAYKQGWNECRAAMIAAAGKAAKRHEAQEQPAPSMPDLLESLRCACNYIDKLGGVSQQYRAMLASLESKP